MSQQWDGKSKGNKAGYKIFIGLLKIGGIKPAYFLLKIVAQYYIWFVPKATRPLKQFYKQVGYAPKEVKQLIRKNIQIFGQTIIDKIVIMSGLKHNIKVERTGGHYLNQLAEQGEGGILVSAHLGNYELAGQLLKRLDSVINIVMFDGEDTQIKAYMDKITGPKTFNIIYIKNDLSHIFEMSAALRRNELICLHADRLVEGNRSIEHDFFGASALFPLGTFILASKLKAPVCFVFAIKSDKDKYHFYSTPPQKYEGRGDIGARVMLDDYVAEVEKMVKKYPEQWFNYFDFWKQ